MENLGRIINRVVFDSPLANPINKISVIKLRFADLERSDWLENTEYPIRMLKIRGNLMLNFMCRIVGSGPG